jgi:hypothetical protein
MNLSEQALMNDFSHCLRVWTTYGLHVARNGYFRQLIASVFLTFKRGFKG